MIPPSSLTPDDIKKAWERAQLTIVSWDMIRTANTVAELLAFQEEVGTSLSGIEHIEDELETQIGDLKNKLRSVHNLQKDLKRYAKLANDKAWNIRKSL